jgi:4-amino-4-deoxy-L-arabinose transferase-like glycosyltransferase
LAGAAVLVRLVLCLQVAGGPLPQIQALWPESDNYFFDAWGRRIAGGDLLQRAPWHPMASWMEDVADQALSEDPALATRLGLATPRGDELQEHRALLWDRWLGGATFFQEPAYPYLIGLTYWLGGPDAWHVFAWQLALGVVGVLLVHALARRVFSHTAAAAAGLLALLAPVPLFYEVTLLRDGLVFLASLALALLMHWAVEGPRRRWLLLGIAFGAAALIKQTFLALPLLMAAWRLVTARADLRDRLATAGLVGAGMALALLPAMVRNAMVGVPLLAINGSAAAMLPVFHTVGATPFQINVDLAYAGILSRSEGSAIRSLILAAQTHASAWDFVGLQLQKAAMAWHGFEAPNNVDFYLFRQGAPLLWFLPARLPLLVPLAALGLASAPRRSWPLLLTLTASLAGLVASTALSRYRAPLLAGLLPLAGAGVVQVVAWARLRHWVPLGVGLVASSSYLAWAFSEPPGRPDRLRAAEYASVAEWYVPRSAPLAALHLLEAERLSPGSPLLALRLGQLLLASGDAQAALPHLGYGLARLGPAAAIEDRLLYARALEADGRPREAVAVLRAILEDEPGNARAVEYMRRYDPRATIEHGAGATTP